MAEITFKESEAVMGVNAFALEMYNKLAKVPGNLFFSPFSIFSALAMTSLGAESTTLSEMLGCLKMSNYEKDVFHSWFKQFTNYLMNNKTKKDYTLTVANALFGEQSFTFIEKFIQETSKYYSVRLEAKDFMDNFEESRGDINDWVSRETNNKINDMLPPDSLDSETKLVLVNAIYFKGDWLQKFDPKGTEEGDFHVSNTEVVKIPFMYNSFKALNGYSKPLKSKILELPYKGNSLSMIIILPTLEETTLEKVENSLTPSLLSSFQLTKHKLDVCLPKFKLESSFNLNDKLKEMGMVELFDRLNADLSGIEKSKKLYVSSVVHKAFIEVNEEGTEAAASTGVSIAVFACGIRTEAFRADHPFIFFIRDNRTNSILFLGKVIKP